MEEAQVLKIGVIVLRSVCVSIESLEVVIKPTKISLLCNYHHALAIVKKCQ